MLIGRADDVAALARALADPGLVLLTGPAGIGKTALGIEAVRATRRPPFAGGGLRTLAHVPGFALGRAVGGRLPSHDAVLAAEAVRLRVGPGILVLDDAQWADPLSVSVALLLARRTRVLVCLRPATPAARELAARITADARLVLEVGPLADGPAGEVVRSVVPAADAARVAAVVARSGGNPLVLGHLARSGGDPASLRQAVAALLAELPQSARTGLAALGALGRPAPAGMLREGVPELSAAGLVVVLDNGSVLARESAIAEVALALLPAEQRTDLHAHLAAALPPGEAAAHFAAAGRIEEAIAAARAAAGTASSDSERARLSCLAVTLAGAAAEPAERCAAARAALVVGDLGVAAGILDAGETGPDGDLLRAELALAHGDSSTAIRLLGSLGEVSDPARGDLLRARALLARDPGQAYDAAAAVAETGGELAADARGVMAAALLTQHLPGWDELLTEAAELARAAGNWSAECRGALLHADALTEHGRTAEALDLSVDMAGRSRERHALAWQLRFEAVALWARLHTRGELDAVVEAGSALVAGAAPGDATARAAAAVALALADGGNPRAGRRILDGPSISAARAPANVRRLLAWTDAEVSLLAGDYGLAEARGVQLASVPDLSGALACLTAAFAAVAADAADAPEAPEWAAESAVPAMRALGADADAVGGWLAAADAWRGVIARERVRALWAAGAHRLLVDRGDGVATLVAAHREASAAGLLGMRALIAGTLRRAGASEPTTRSDGMQVTGKEREVLDLVATGLTSRAIAAQLGLSVLTVDSHIRSAMTRLGAPTRLAAALRAQEEL